MKYSFNSRLGISIITVLLTSMLFMGNMYSANAQETDAEVTSETDTNVAVETDSTGTSAETQAESATRVEVARTNRIDDGIIVQNVDDAIEYLYDSGLTRFSSRGEFMHDQGLRRDEAAAFFVRFVRDVLGRDMDGDGRADFLDTDSDNDSIPDSVERCQFSDLDQAHADLVEEIEESCRLGLFRGHAGRFMPTDEFSNAHAMTVMIRLIEGMQEEPEDNWAREYFARARRAGLVQSLSAELEINLYRPITRGDVAKMIEGSAVYIASRDNERCTTIDPVDADDDGDGIPTRSYERCVIEGPLVRAQARVRAHMEVCRNGSEDCDDADADRNPSSDRSAVKELDKATPAAARPLGTLDKATPYIITEAAMPCDGATCPDGSCVATSDECVGFIDDNNVVFVTASADTLYCRGQRGESEACPRERNQEGGIEMVTDRMFTEDYKEYLTGLLTQRLQLPGVDDVVYSLREGRVVGADGEVEIVVVVEPSERALAAQANADYDGDDTDLVPACITASGQGECPETKTCSDGSTVACTCNTGICLCKMCSISSTLQTK